APRDGFRRPAAWAPQLVAAGAFFYVTLLLLWRASRRPPLRTWPYALTLSSSVTAGLLCSIWVGGVALAFGGPCVLLALLLLPSCRRVLISRFPLLAACAVATGCLAAPFLNTILA